MLRGLPILVPGRSGTTLLRAMLEAHPAVFGARCPAQYLELRYEMLVREPRATSQAVTTFLDLPFDERMLRHPELDLSLGNIAHLPTLEGARDPIHQEAIGRWRTEFGTEDLAELDRLLGPTLAVLGCEPGAENAGRRE